MTSTLKCLTLPTYDPSQFDVFWACGKRTHGLIQVRMAVPVDDPSVAAELWAFAHLLQEREVCGVDRTGKSLQLTCSHGAIRKLALGQSAKAHLAPYAAFLRTRFAEARIEVSKDDAIFDINRYRNREVLLTCSGPLDPTALLPDLGAVSVSYHALERYAQRNCASSPSAAWRGLCTELARPGGCLLSPSAEDPSPTGRTTLIFRTPGGWRLVIVREGHRHRLVTVTFQGERANRSSDRHSPFSVRTAGTVSGS